MNHNVANSCAFDPLHVPIKGTSLIEASAGTGKPQWKQESDMLAILTEKRAKKRPTRSGPKQGQF